MPGTLDNKWKSIKDLFWFLTFQLLHGFLCGILHESAFNDLALSLFILLALEFRTLTATRPQHQQPDRPNTLGSWQQVFEECGVLCTAANHVQRPLHLGGGIKAYRARRAVLWGLEFQTQLAQSTKKRTDLEGWRKKRTNNTKMKKITKTTQNNTIQNKTKKTTKKQDNSLTITN